VKGARVRPIQFGSRRCTDSEQHYHSFTDYTETDNAIDNTATRRVMRFNWLGRPPSCLPTLAVSLLLASLSYRLPLIPRLFDLSDGIVTFDNQVLIRHQLVDLPGCAALETAALSLPTRSSADSAANSTTYCTTTNIATYATTADFTSNSATDSNKVPIHHSYPRSHQRTRTNAALLPYPFLKP
jgi:hypothetical protein